MRKFREWLDQGSWAASNVYSALYLGPLFIAMVVVAGFASPHLNRAGILLLAIAYMVIYWVAARRVARRFHNRHCRPNTVELFSCRALDSPRSAVPRIPQQHDAPVRQPDSIYL